LNHPVLFIVLVVLFVALVIWLLPKIWRGVKKVFGKLRSLFGGKEAADQAPVVPPPVEAPIQQQAKDPPDKPIA